MDSIRFATLHQDEHTHITSFPNSGDSSRLETGAILSTRQCVRTLKANLATGRLTSREQIIDQLRIVDVSQPFVASVVRIIKSFVVQP
jgi:hypothetical protein